LKTIAIVLLAAGESRRMGVSKQLLEVQGKTLLERTLEVINACVNLKKVVVLGANAEAHQKITSQFPDLDIVINTNWKDGLGSSIKSGLEFVIRSSPFVDGVMFLVCDQPFINTEHLTHLINEFLHSIATIVASGYNNTEGVPALFGRVHFDELMNLDDSSGAKNVISKNSERKIVVPFPAGSVDLDTPEDFRSYLNSLKE
jgi:molybdenum cofactor cytidylyltransferase